MSERKAIQRLLQGPASTSASPLTGNLQREEHVFFWALPRGERFRHQGERYTKTAEEQATDARGQRWVFEVHYGALIPRERAQSLKLPANAYRNDGPPERRAGRRR